MPEENNLYIDLVERALYDLEKYDLNDYVVKIQSYKTVQNVIVQDEYINAEKLKRILAVCIRDIKTFSADAINLIAAIVDKIKLKTYDLTLDLVPVALAVLNMINSIATFNKVDSLMVLSYRTLSSCPEDTLIALADHHEELMETFNLYCNVNITEVNIRLEVLNFLMKLLQILPHEKRRLFVERGITIWFTKIIPLAVMFDQTSENSETEKSLEILELLTDDLIHIEYKNNSHWHKILECICDKKKYPAIMKNLLHTESDAWHRLWTIFIRLLKNQVTQSLNSIGSPINSMLPVVEAAFKLNGEKRIKAFECWNVLIDSFSSKANERNLNKTLKLLIIPLKSNNARAEETVVAKFHCWWHFLRKFQNKMDVYLDIVLVSFLNFCFGQYNAVDKFVPGLISVNVKRLCNQAMVDIVGHVNCNGCTELPQLHGKIINTKHLVDNWNHWIYSLTLVIKAENTDYGLTKQQMTCLWKSFIMTIGELPENNIRKDLFAELLTIITNLVKDANANILDITFNILIMSLFEENKTVKQLFKADKDLIIKIVRAIMEPSLSVCYKSLTTAELVTKFKLITQFMFDEEVYTISQTISGLLFILPKTDTALVLWNALIEHWLELNHEEYVPMAPYGTLLMWPLRSISFFTEVKVAAMTWYKAYELMYPKLNATDINNEIMEICLLKSNTNNLSIVYFKLCTVLSILKQNFHKSNSMTCEKELKLLLNLTKAINYEFFKPIFPLLVERIVDIMNVVSLDVNDVVAALILVSVKNVLHMLTQEHKNHSTDAKVMVLIEDLLKSIDKIFAVQSYAKLIPDITYHLLKCFPLLSGHLPIQSTILSILKSILATVKTTDTNYNKINSLINIFANTKSDTVIELKENKLTTLHPKEVPRQTKVKEANIVKTVVENGEEYVVVKSNWKFNPKKLTENQKEKLQRKREDIPALYQDLSQSQDEFKLVSWRADSQDTTSRSRTESKSSKPGNNETASEILNNLPSTDVVPRILENILTDNERKSSKAENSTDDNFSKVEPPLTISKTTKSPRMALKDRVFRNVRNLIENSGIHKESQTSSVDLNVKVNSTTPTHNKHNNLVSTINSAPTLLSADRPSRVKRKPKKFEDLLLLTSKKRRNSLQDIHSNKANINNHGIENSRIQLAAGNKDENNMNNLHHNVVSNMEKLPHNNENVLVKDGNKSIKISKIIDEKLDAATLNESNTDMSDRGNQEGTYDKKATIPYPKSKELAVSKKPDISEVIISNGSENLNDLIDFNSSENLSKVESNATINIALESVTQLSNNLRETSDPKTSMDVEKLLTPKIAKPCKVVLSQNIDKTANKQSAIPKVANPVKENSPPRPTKKVKEAIQKLEVLHALNENLVPKISQDVKVLLIPKTSENVENELPAKLNDNDDMNISNLVDPKDLKERIPADNQPKLCHDIEIKASNATSEPNDFATSQSKENDESTSKHLSKCAINSTKKVRKSRIESELAIDMVEGHPYLNRQSEKRLTRKAFESVSTSKRKNATQNQTNLKGTTVNNLKQDKKTKEKTKKTCSSTSIIVNDSQEKYSDPRETLLEDFPCSDDVIESSQDSTITTISVKSAKNILKSAPTTPTPVINIGADIRCSQSILSDQTFPTHNESNDDIALPINKTHLEDNNQDLTENMDTEPLDERNISEVVTLTNAEVPVITVAREDSTVGPETQEIAEADTQPINPEEVMDIDVTPIHILEPSAGKNISEPEMSDVENNVLLVSEKSVAHDTINNDTETLSDSACAEIEETNATSSPFKDEAQRQQDFINNTTEISPIKTMSPDREKKSPSPETSNDYVIIKFTSPVHSNGEPFDKCSPEVFTEDKTSPDKRDLSPPRVVLSITNTSPSSSLSLKKNRPQVRSGGRAAHMLGLCVPDKVQDHVNSEKNEYDESKKGSTNTPAKRNLRCFYNSENTDSSSSSTCENDDGGNFLKFRRSLPTVDSSPSVSILKRKHMEATDEQMTSPASKRKRVSFHDPPVSVTVSVQKYLEPGSSRSPQNSAQKRLERQSRQYTPLNSQKRLDNVFQLHSVLSKAVESFSENEVVSIVDDTQPISLDETPVVEVVRISELNDSDPICPELIDCMDSIVNIAGELSSSAMKSLFIKELEGKVETVGDLAMMTELEVNRLCIKAPKIKVARKVLSDYAKKIEFVSVETPDSFDEVMKEPFTESSESSKSVEVVQDPFNESLVPVKCVNMEVQTDSTESMDMGSQAEEIPIRITSTQTDAVLTVHDSVQTDDSGSKSTADIVRTCLTEKTDFIEQLSEQLEESNIEQISEKLPLTSLTNLLIKKITPSDVTTVINSIFESISSNDNSNEFLYIEDYLCNKFSSKELMKLCSRILGRSSDKPT